MLSVAGMNIQVPVPSSYSPVHIFFYGHGRFRSHCDFASHRTGAQFTDENLKTPDLSVDPCARTGSRFIDESINLLYKPTVASVSSSPSSTKRAMNKFKECVKGGEVTLFEWGSGTAADLSVDPQGK